MSTTGGCVLLVDHGDLPSLAAVVTRPDPGRIVLWHLREQDEAATHRYSAVEDHARLLGDADLVVSEAWRPRGTSGADLDPVLGQALILVQAAIVARQAGCARIVWPVQVGPNPEVVSCAVDQATLVTELAAPSVLGPSRQGGAIVIDLPLVDLDDEQVLDLADDCGAPPRAFWPCEGGGSEPCGVCRGCTRWRRAHDGLGLAWPWAGAATAA